jgi:hypothetical protein
MRSSSIISSTTLKLWKSTVSISVVRVSLGYPTNKTLRQTFVTLVRLIPDGDMCRLDDAWLAASSPASVLCQSFAGRRLGCWALRLSHRGCFNEGLFEFGI